MFFSFVTSSTHRNDVTCRSCYFAKDSDMIMRFCGAFDLSYPL